MRTFLHRRETRESAKWVERSQSDSRHRHLRRKEQTAGQPLPTRAGFHTFHIISHRTRKDYKALSRFPQIIATSLRGRMPSLVRHAIAIVVHNDSTYSVC